MGQQNLGTAYGKGPNGFTPLNVDTEGNLITTSGGTNTALNVTAAKVIKAAPGRIAKIVVTVPGTTSGALVINDCLTVAAAAAANQVVSIAFGSMSIGQVIALDFPCLTGIVVSAVPGAGSPIYSISYD